jgi:hypothetical protein
MDEQHQELLDRLVKALTQAIIDQAPAEALDSIAGAVGRLRQAGETGSAPVLGLASAHAEAVLDALRCGRSLPDASTLSSDRHELAQRERRRHPRFEVYATVRLESVPSLLSVRNISVSGALLNCDGHDVSTLEAGRSLLVSVFHPDRPDERIQITARVVRHVPGGIALTWEENRDITTALLRLIGGTG